MKKIAVVVLGFILTSNIIYAQDCKYEKNEIDKFTGQKSIITAKVKVSKGAQIKHKLDVSKVEFSVKLENGQRILCIILKVDEGMVVLKGGEKLICLTNLGDKIELNFINKPVTLENRNSGRPNFIYEYLIDEASFNKLLDDNIKDVRVEAFMGTFDFTILTDVVTKKIFACIK